MADINLSLDEIIKKRSNKPSTRNTKLIENRKTKGAITKRLGNGPKPFVKKRVEDARQMIQRNKLFRQTNSAPVIGIGPVLDARYRLEALRHRKRVPKRNPIGIGGAPLGSFIVRNIPNAIEGMAIDDMECDDIPLRCTVKNEPIAIRHYDWDRPQEDESEAIERLRFPRSNPRDFLVEDPDWRSLRVSVKNQGIPMGILKRPPPSPPHLSPPVIRQPPMREPAHGRTLSDRFCKDRNIEAATKIRALKAQLDETSQQSIKAEAGHRIVVSNLVSSVTHDDVKELFADIGELMSSKVVRPGVAEVVYRRYEDAMTAVEVYHDRQLDDQPMKCLLVKNPKKIKGNNFELDMNALRNALHKKSTP